MPIITVQVVKDVVLTSPEQKRELLQKLTDTFIGVVGEVARPYTYCLIQEVPAFEWSIAGKPLPDLPFLYGPDYAGMHAKANSIMRSYVEQQQAAPNPVSGNGTGSTTSIKVTLELVGKAYAALGTGDPEQIKQYWAEDLNWLVPGHHPLAGWYKGRDAFLGFMQRVGRLSGNSFRMDPVSVMTGDDWSSDVTHNLGYAAGYEGTGQVPYTKLDIDVVHVLRWRDGKVIEGKGAIFGDGSTNFDQFWSTLARAAVR